MIIIIHFSPPLPLPANSCQYPLPGGLETIPMSNSSSSSSNKRTVDSTSSISGSTAKSSHFLRPLSAAGMLEYCGGHGSHKTLPDNSRSSSAFSSSAPTPTLEETATTTATATDGIPQSAQEGEDEEQEGRAGGNKKRRKPRSSRQAGN